MKTCTKCKLHKDSNNINCVPLEGNPNADVVFISESVAYKVSDEIEETFETLLKYADIDPDSIAFVSALRCYKASGTKIAQKDIDTCFAHLYRDLKSVNPKLVVTFGEVPFLSVSGKDKNAYKNYKNTLFYSDKIKCKVLSTHKLESSLYNRSNLEVLKKTFKNLPELLNKKPKDIKWYDYTFVDDVKDFDRSKFENSKYLYIDIESTGLDYINDTLTILQISNGEDIVVFDKSILKDLNLPELFEDKLLIGQDFAFDMKFLCHQYDIKIKDTMWYWDTCLAEYIISGMFDNDLTALVWKYCPESGGYDDYVKSSGGAHLVDDPEELHKYGANDVGVLPKIVEKQKEMLIRLGKLGLYKDIVMPTNKILTKSSMLGVKYDLDYLDYIDEVYKKKQQKLLYKIEFLPEIRVTENHFQKKFNPNSSQQVKYLLLDVYKLPVLATTNKKDDGPPSCTKKEMKHYSEHPHYNPYCKTMEKYGTYSTLRSTFLSGAKKFLYGDIAHTKYSIHSTSSGRPNSKGPNLLNIPKIDEIKKCFISKDGHSFVYSDEGQFEVRLAAVVYNDPKLLAICNDLTKDFHCNMSANAFSKDYQTLYDGYKAKDNDIILIRNHGKSVTFGVIYQTGADGLSKQINKPKRIAQKFIDDFYNNFPDLRDNIDCIKKLVIKQGFVDNYFGFRRSWKFHSKEDHGTQREAVNHMVQSLAWNLIELAMIQIDKKLTSNKMESNILMQVYDSIIVESPDDEVPEVAKIVKSVMEGVNKPYDGINKVIFVSDIEVGKNLGDMHEFNVN